MVDDPEIFVKFCPAQFNPFNGGTYLKLGTIQEYREADSSFSFADADEGQETFSTWNARGAQAPPEVQKILLPFTGGRDIILHGINLVPQHLNYYIWCCSKIPRSLTATQAERLGYNSYYEITDMDRFINCLLPLLSKCLKPSHIVDASQEKIKEIIAKNIHHEVEFHGYAHQVVYVEEKKSLIELGTLSSYAGDIEPEMRPFFAKRKKNPLNGYEYDKDFEYRIIFWIQHPGYGQLEPKKDPLYLPILADFPIAPI